MASIAMSAKEKADQARWRAESDMRVLADAAAINADSKRMAAVKKAAAEQISHLQGVVGKPAPVRKPK